MTYALYVLLHLAGIALLWPRKRLTLAEWDETALTPIYRPLLVELVKP